MADLDPQTVELVATAWYQSETPEHELPSARISSTGTRYRLHARAVLTALADRVLPPGAVETVEYADKCDCGRCSQELPWGCCEGWQDKRHRHTHSRRVFTWSDQPGKPTQLTFGWTPIEETTR